MTQTMVNGHPEGLQTVYLQVDQSNLIHMGGAMPTNLQVSSFKGFTAERNLNLAFLQQFQQIIATPVTQTPTYTMNVPVQTVTPQVTVVKRHRDM